MSNLALHVLKIHEKNSLQVLQQAMKQPAVQVKTCVCVTVTLVELA